MSTTHLTQWLVLAAHQFPEKTALIEGEHAVTWAALHQRVINTAAYLRQQQVERGDRVLVWLPNGVDFVVCFWAVQYLQAVFVPVNPDTPLARVRWLLDNAASHLLIAQAEQATALASAPGNPDLQVLFDQAPGVQESGSSLLSLQQMAELSPAMPLPVQGALDIDLACLIYTSGSTGDPKGVMLTQRNMLSAADSVASYLQLAASDRIFCTIPMSFDYGLYQAIMAAKVGATLIVEKDFSRPLFALKQLVKHKATVLPIVPTLLAIIAPLAKRYDFSSLRKITNTAAALHPSDIDLLTSLFPQTEIFSMYGLTECHRCTWLPPALLSQHKDSVGYAIPNTELWVVDDEGVAHRSNATGELVIRGATVMRGYWRNPEQTAKKLRPGPLPGESVLYTGDVCRLDEHGLLYFLSRNDDILKTNGEKVAPREVEGVLKRMPGVLQVAVIGVAHPVYGDEIVACIECVAPLDTALLKAFCQTHLEAYKRPHRYYFSEALPKNNNGKVDRGQLSTLLPRRENNLNVGSTQQTGSQHVYANHH
ncbi:Long-chain-fatty-acid--CoA ligase [Pseudomonas sp. Bi123]|jgi:amino acid adenylation domain-containing protein|uniref:class I adenylate-forming enzyme family protein n=1 Tax=Pseudomonas sp. 008 TaxID=2803906 RepID=UPI00195047F9|nr:AMP-binding protein [Pseudomonas sp. 008]GID03102.1 AMP-dependent ligase [Pseudomonas sp. 008]CAH0218747.1 Long-chain-fatty-acid--CoA ligase [Pseudomonas sp. Bi123]